MNQTTIIKICGITDPELAATAVKLGTHYVGIMMYNLSKRYVNLNTAKTIAAHVTRAGGIPVGVFVDTPAHEIKSICQLCDINVVQLHGDISRRGHQYLPESLQRIYVLHVNDDGTINADTTHGLEYLDNQRDMLLFDGLKGGSGRVFNHNKFSYHGKIPFLCAGGLNPDNISTAIVTMRPYGVDVSSGVENAHGVKDKMLIKQFINNVNQSVNHVKYST